MKQVIVEMPDADMRTLKRVARQLARAPAELLQEQVKSILAPKRAGPLKLAKVYKRTRPSKVRSFVSVNEMQSTPVMTIPSQVEVSSEPTSTDEGAARERRLQILRRTSGMMKGDPSFPKDGLEYQTSLRTEWE